MQEGDSFVYLDHNATTPLSAGVVERMQSGLLSLWGNASSAGRFGQCARAAVSDCLQELSLLLNCSPAHLTVTSGGTEANATALRSVISAASASAPVVVVTTPFEHPAVSKQLAVLPDTAVIRTPLDSAGRVIEQQFVDNLIHHKPALVTIMWANNETGVVQDMHRLVALTRQHAPNAVFHSDAAQIIGKLPIDVSQLDMVTVVGHKFYAPKHIGALYSRIPFTPLFVGGSQQGGRRAGTESALLCAGLAVAAKEARLGMDANVENMRKQRDLLWKLLKEAFPNAVSWTPFEFALPNTLSVCLVPDSKLLGSEIVEKCAAQGIYFSAGAACHHGSVVPSETLVAIGADAERAKRTLRITTGTKTTEQDITTCVNALKKLLMA
jgi:cysteine desulfurase